MVLDSLPAELLLSVTSFLSTPDYNAVRLTCRAVQATLYDSWSKEFFTTRQFSLQPFSLEVLLAISKHESLGRLLKRLIIGTNSVEYRGRSMDADQETQARYKRNFQMYFAAQQHARTIGSDYRMLAEAISNLPNLTMVEVRNFDSNYDGGRTRDATTWKSYGWKVYENDTGEQMTFSPSSPGSQGVASIASDTFQKVFSAAMECPNLKALIFHTQANVRHLHTSGIFGRALWIPNAADAKYRNGLVHLETLMLVLGNTIHSEGPELLSRYFEDFAAYIPNLRHLRLNWLDAANAQHEIAGILPALSQKLPFLRRFEFGMAAMAPSALLELQQLQSIEDLSLFRISLQYLPLPDKKPGWPEVLRSMATAMPNLKSITLRLLQQSCMDVRGFTWRARVCFKPSPDVVVETIPQADLLGNVTINDKRHHNLAAAIEETLDLMVIDDEDFRRTNGRFSALPQAHAYYEDDEGEESISDSELDDHSAAASLSDDVGEDDSNEESIP